MEVCYYDYVLKKKIGSGSFGDVWLGISFPDLLGKHKADKTEPVAIKLQQIGPEDVDKSLYKETKILQSLSGKGRLRLSKLGSRNWSDVGLRMHSSSWHVNFSAQPCKT